MVKMCEKCGGCWGGLVHPDYPTPVECPWCVDEVLKQAAKDVAHIVEAERAGEQITAEIMEMRLR